MNKIKKELYTIILKHLQTHLNVDKEKLFDESTDHNTAFLRHILMYCLHVYEINNREIAEMFKCKRESVYYSFDRVKKAAETDKQLKKQINAMFLDMNAVVNKMKEKNKKKIIIFK